MWSDAPFQNAPSHSARRSRLYRNKPILNAPGAPDVVGCGKAEIITADNVIYGFSRVKEKRAARRVSLGRPLTFMVRFDYGPNLFLYSSERMKALIISALSSRLRAVSSLRTSSPGRLNESSFVSQKS